MLRFGCVSCGSLLVMDCGTSLCKCGVCGVQQPVPVTLNPEMLSLYNLACDAQRDGGFHACRSYCETILSVFPESACVHWLAVLAEYGVEYIRTPQSKKPAIESGYLNVMRVSDSMHYLAAMDHADADMEVFLEKNASLIEQQQKVLYDAAVNAPMYDVFLSCSSDFVRDSEREDHLAAMRIFKKLVKNGFRVYMRGVCGETDEASVFSALHSAKVMFVIGNTASVFFENSVRNDWSRFIQLSQSASRGKLYVLHEGFSNEVLPDELSLYPSYSYLNHAALSAVLQEAVTCIKTAGTTDELRDRNDIFIANAVAEQYNVAARMRAKDEQRGELFANLCEQERKAQTKEEFACIAEGFLRISGYKDSRQRAERCQRRVTQLHYEKLAEEETLRLAAENKKAVEQAEKDERESGTFADRNRQRLVIAGALFAFFATAAAVVLLLTQIVLPYAHYYDAKKQMLAGNTEEALSVFEELGDFLNSEEYAQKIENAQLNPEPTMPFALR